MNNFLSFHNVLMNVSIWDKTCLVRRHYSIHTHFHAIDNNFTKNFINSITKCNWSKLVHLLNIDYLWNKTKLSFVDLLYTVGIAPQIMNKLAYTLIPITSQDF